MGYLFPAPSKPDYHRPNYEVMFLKSSGLPRNPFYFNILFLLLLFPSIAKLSSSNCAVSPSSPVQTSEGWLF